MKRILVVDDDIIMRETLRDILIFEGFKVCEAEGGNSALEKISNQDYDLIITDILMPERDGFEVIQESKRKNPRVQVLAISGGGYISADSYLKMANDMGADAILPKPFDVDSFISLVSNLAETSNKKA